MLVDYPSECPACSAKTIVKLPELLCPNDNCPEKISGVFFNACTRRNLDIRGVGEEVAEALSKQFKTLFDFLTCEVSDLSLMPFGESIFGYTRAQSLYEEIRRSRYKSWNILLHSLGCPALGQPECDEITKRYSLDDLLQNVLREEFATELTNLPGIGTKTAVAFCTWLLAQSNWLGSLSEVFDTNKMSSSEGPLSGKSFVITGKLSKPRAEIEDWIKSRGGTISSSISKNTSYLVTGEEAGSKLEKATKLNVQIITEEQLKTLA